MPCEFTNEIAVLENVRAKNFVVVRRAKGVMFFLSSVSSPVNAWMRSMLYITNRSLNPQCPPYVNTTLVNNGLKKM